MDSRKYSIALTALGLLACSPAPQPPADGGSNDAAPEASMPEDASNDVQATSCSYPPGPYGSDEGRLFRPFVLPNCDGSGDFHFDDQSFCDASATVIVIAAGWCRPCQIEAPMIQELITEGYRDRGVRVITVYFQNPDYSPPTMRYCNQWRDSFGLTNTMVIDPMGVTQIYVPGLAFPANLIVDRHGRIRYRQYGTSSGLSDLRDALDAVLASP